ncbi:MAG: hypothetical protein LBT81_05365 [Helicobacteraceae bacterium]|nr:hypothetical protein [Helicobacteraceae bacterium]
MQNKNPPPKPVRWNCALSTSATHGSISTSLTPEGVLGEPISPFEREGYA